MDDLSAAIVAARAAAERPIADFMPANPSLCPDADLLRAWTLRATRLAVVGDLTAAAEAWRPGERVPVTAEDRRLMASVVWPAIGERLAALSAAPTAAAWRALLALLAEPPARPVTPLGLP